MSIRGFKSPAIGGFSSLTVGRFLLAVGASKKLQNLTLPSLISNWGFKKKNRGFWFPKNWDCESLKNRLCFFSLNINWNEMFELRRNKAKNRGFRAGQFGDLNSQKTMGAPYERRLIRRDNRKAPKPRRKQITQLIKVENKQKTITTRPSPSVDEPGRLLCSSHERRWHLYRYLTHNRYFLNHSCGNAVPVR